MGCGGDPLFRRIFVPSCVFLKKKFKSVFKNEEITRKNQLPDSLENKQSGGLATGDVHSCAAWVPWFPRPHPAGLLVSVQQAFERGVSVPGMLAISAWPSPAPGQSATKASGHCPPWQFFLRSQKCNHRAQNTEAQPGWHSGLPGYREHIPFHFYLPTGLDEKFNQLPGP